MNHSTDEFRYLAMSNEILRTQVGSGLHGISLPGTDDRDEMGICIEPPNYVTGLEVFEQYEWHTAWEREGGKANRSGYGDFDLVIYSFRKWMRLALQGNPTIILLLFAPAKEIVNSSTTGRMLMAERDNIISIQAGDRFLGYLRAQKMRMQGIKHKHTNRPELVELHGFDTKFAGHAVRLGIQGLELMRSGTITLPMPVEDAGLVKDIRRGCYTKEAVIEMINYLEADLLNAIGQKRLPEYPDRMWANNFLHNAYLNQWREMNYYPV